MSCDKWRLRVNKLTFSLLQVPDDLMPIWFDKLTNRALCMKGYTYILKVSNGQYYVGSTTNLERRLAEHQRGEGAKFTKAYLPVELVYCEEFPQIGEAFKREKQLQKWSRAKKEALIKGDIEALLLLSKSK